MKTLLALLAALVALPAVAEADHFETSAPPLASVLDKARSTGKPVLIEFSAVWCVPCKALAKELAKPENQKRLESFVFQNYDGERGEGVALAQRYRVTGYPTLVVLDASGNELARGGSAGPEAVGAWLDETSRAAVSGKALQALLKERPKDIGLLWQMAQRARASKDIAAERSWLGKIEAVDKSPAKDEASKAAWRRAELAVSDRLNKDARKLALAHLRKYPGNPAQALAVLAAAGADKKTLEAEYKRVIEATSDGGTLNNLVYTALGAGAFDAALAAAQKQVKLSPEEANPYDSLAEVHHYRGEKDKAIATEKTGMSKKAPPELLAGMRDNLRRFESSGPSGDVRVPGSLDRIFESKMLLASSAAADPVAITKHMLDVEKASVTKACSPKSKGLESALVRVTIGKDAKLGKVEVLEPGAGDGLKKCLADSVRAIRIPADNPPARVLIEVPFDPTAVPKLPTRFPAAKKPAPAR
jgi:thiol-disulfide isomerase/thioredoxin